MLGVKSSAVGLIVCADNRGLHMKTVEVAKKTDNYLLFNGGELGTTCARWLYALKSTHSGNE